MNITCTDLNRNIFKRSAMRFQELLFLCLSKSRASSPASMSFQEEIHDFTNLDKIGEGSYSVVYKGLNQKTKKLVAIKKIDKRQRNEYIKRFLPRELKLVKSLNHPNVIRVFDIIESPTYVCMIEEYAEKGDLLQLIKAKKRIDEVEGRLLFRQLIEGLRYLEMKRIVHRDLKCENLFLDAHYNLKIGDFGFARYLLSGEVSNTFCGSKAYVALEIMQSTEYCDNSIDIWSSGVVLYVMITGENFIRIMPFDDRKQNEMISMQRDHKIRFPRGMPSDSARKLIMYMLHPDPNKRATLEKILTSEWLGGTKYALRGPVVEEQKEEDSGCSTASQISESDLQALRRTVD
ncbi:hypothetical protein M3Y97_00297900 [Aphelenchoides bicaudatus]|nr:hypothetical protein M3Y97_00297900 [Aphelenchoides bicaudatus]